MIYMKLSPPGQFSTAPAGYAVLQTDIEVSKEDHGKYAVAILPEEDSRVWHFVVPGTRDVWVKGLDGKSKAIESISLFASFDEAMEAMQQSGRSFRNSDTAAIFKAELDENENLELSLIEEFTR